MVRNSPLVKSIVSVCFLLQWELNPPRKREGEMTTAMMDTPTRTQAIVATFGGALIAGLVGALCPVT